MTHRKKVHPSNKKCKNFPGNCKHGSECWYVHTEEMEIDQVVENSKSTQHIFKCDICEEIVKDGNELMKHKSDMHTDSVSNSRKEQVFQKVTSNSFPPD